MTFFIFFALFLEIWGINVQKVRGHSRTGQKAVFRKIWYIAYPVPEVFPKNLIFGNY